MIKYSVIIFRSDLDLANLIETSSESEDEAADAIDKNLRNSTIRAMSKIVIYESTFGKTC